ncbi:MAG: M42 family peptidase [Acholeplasmataceae bacterium]|nr:MAG: M42 family peptidase [Acholeplasmataceae bacterium]
MLKPLYKDLFDLAGTSGYEHDVRAYMKAFMNRFPSFEVRQDGLGSLFAIKRAKDPKAPVVMIAGHMDEVGLMVVAIKDNGMLHVKNIGGLIGEVFVSQVLNVHTRHGVIKGVIGAIPPHMRKEQNTKLEELLLDIGASSKEEAVSFGVQLGDMVLYDNPFAYTQNKRRVIAKAIDNRYGCGLALETIEYFDKQTLPFTLVAGATVQEEVGLRGAETATNLFAPDIFIALDASPVNDTLDANSLGALGKGFLIRMYDPRNVMHQGLLKLFVDLAKKHDIAYQYFTSKGGTDAAKALDMHAGIPATTIGLPARYIHSTAAMMDLGDLDHARKMLLTLLETFTPDLIRELKEGTYA